MIHESSADDERCPLPGPKRQLVKVMTVSGVLLVSALVPAASEARMVGASPHRMVGATPARMVGRMPGRMVG